jgi:hypothetical protein
MKLKALTFLKRQHSNGNIAMAIPQKALYFFLYTSFMALGMVIDMDMDMEMEMGINMNMVSIY